MNNQRGAIKFSIKHTSCDSFIIGLIPHDHINFEKNSAINGICVTSNG